MLDALILAWVLAWIGLGVSIGVNVRTLTGISNTVQTDGRAVETIGGSLRQLRSIPFIGGRIARDASQVQRAGASAVRSGASSASSVRALSVLLAIAVALLPSIPVLGFYLPLRLARRREAAALRRTLLQHGGDPELERFLARRAVEALGYHHLRRVAPLPWAEPDGTATAALAAAELRRLGLDPRLVRRDRPGH